MRPRPMTSRRSRRMQLSKSPRSQRSWGVQGRVAFALDQFDDLRREGGKCHLILSFEGADGAGDGRVGQERLVSPIEQLRNERFAGNDHRWLSALYSDWILLDFVEDTKITLLDPFWA